MLSGRVERRRAARIADSIVERAVRRRVLLAVSEHDTTSRVLRSHVPRRSRQRRAYRIDCRPIPSIGRGLRVLPPPERPFPENEC